MTREQKSSSAPAIYMQVFGLPALSSEQIYRRNFCEMAEQLKQSHPAAVRGITDAVNAFNGCSEKGREVRDEQFV